MTTANVMNTRRNIPNWDISAQDITTCKRKMEHPVIEIFSLGVSDDVVVTSPNNYEINDPENLG